MKELDCRGLACPQPVMRCRDALEKGKPEKIKVIVDNQAAVENVSRFLGKHGYETTAGKRSDNEWLLEGTKVADVACEAPKPAPQQPAASKTLVLITTETLGRGDEELGAKLMVTFLGSLPELGSDLWRIILLNGAVKHAATPGPCLAHLKNLEKSGVSILVCGTCLGHYGLLEKKQVGETTNMMDVVTSLALAGKIIRP